MGIEKIIDRISKLLKLSTSSNSHEAANAAALAAEMMARHQLCEATIRASSDEAAEPQTPDDKPIFVSPKIDTWRGSLAVGIAAGYGCKVYWEQNMRGKKTINAVLHVIGLHDDISSMQYTYQYLERELIRLAHDAWEIQPNRPAGRAAGSWQDNFKLGAAKEIEKRMKEERRKVMDPSQFFDPLRTKALVLVQRDQDAIERMFSKLRIKRINQNFTMNETAFDQGREAGRKISLGGGKGLPSPNQQISAQ